MVQRRVTNRYRMKAEKALEMAGSANLAAERERLLQAARVWTELADRFDWTARAKIASEQAKIARARLRARRAARSRIVESRSASH